LKDKVANGRWFFLVVCILQFISMLVALVLRVCVYPRERDFENFEEGGEGTKAASSSQIQAGGGALQPGSCAAGAGWQAGAGCFDGSLCLVELCPGLVTFRLIAPPLSAV
jgi:hypothetical protein